MAGHKSFGEFTQGANQILLQNGTTVLALREEDSPPAALVIPVKGKRKVEDVVMAAAKMLEGVGLDVVPESIPGTDGLITRLRVDGELGFDIAFRPPGRVMGQKLGFPKFRFS